MLWLSSEPLLMNKRSHLLVENHVTVLFIENVD